MKAMNLNHSFLRSMILLHGLSLPPSILTKGGGFFLCGLQDSRLTSSRFAKKKKTLKRKKPKNSPPQADFLNISLSTESEILHKNGVSELFPKHFSLVKP